MPPDFPLPIRPPETLPFGGAIVRQQIGREQIALRTLSTAYWPLVPTGTSGTNACCARRGAFGRWCPCRR